MSLTAAAVVVGAGPCDQFGYSGAPRCGQLPGGVLPIATGPISMATLSCDHIVQGNEQCVPRMSWVEWTHVILGTKPGQAFVLQSMPGNGE